MIRSTNQPFLKRVRNAGRDEKGQMVLLVAGGMIVVLGFAALAIDLGFMTNSRRSAQNDADSMALAAVQELARRGLSVTDREASATTEADVWAVKNDVDSSEILSYTFGETCDGTAVADTISVRLQRTQTTFLAGVLGINSAELNVCATARTGMAKAGPGMLPIGLLNDDPGLPDICYFDDGTGSAHSNFYYNPDGADLSYAPGGADELCVVKIPRPGAGDTWADGNTGPIRVDEQSQVNPDNYLPDCDVPNANSGANEYGANIVDGGEWPYAPQDLIRTLPGAQTSSTCSSFDTREATYPHTGEDLTDVFMDPDYDATGTPVYTRVDETNPHFGIVPVTTVSGSGSSWVEIIHFVTVYVVGCTETGDGNNTLYTVSIIPVNSTYFAEGQEFVGPGDPGYNSDWPAYTIKLIE